MADIQRRQETAGELAYRIGLELGFTERTSQPKYRREIYIRDDELVLIEEETGTEPLPRGFWR